MIVINDLRGNCKKIIHKRILYYYYCMANIYNKSSKSSCQDIALTMWLVLFFFIYRYFYHFICMCCYKEEITYRSWRNLSSTIIQQVLIFFLRLIIIIIMMKNGVKQKNIDIMYKTSFTPRVSHVPSLLYPYHMLFQMTWFCQLIKYKKQKKKKFFFSLCYIFILIHYNNACLVYVQVIIQNFL